MCYMSNFAKQIQRLQKQFNIDESCYLGEGDEAVVYRIDDERILKIYRKSKNNLFLKNLSNFYNKLNLQNNSTLFLPEIFQYEIQEDCIYSIEKLINAKSLSESNIDETKIVQIIKSVIEGLSSIPLESDYFGEIVSNNDIVKANTWKDYLINKIQSKNYLYDKFIKNIPDLKVILADLTSNINEIIPHRVKKAVIHGDLTQRNILFDAKTKTIAPIDFGILSCIGDVNYEVASCLLWADVDPALSVSVKDQLRTELLKGKRDDEVKTIELYKPIIRIISADYFDDKFFDEAITFIKLYKLSF